jgi:hypothetical protein
MVEVSMPRGDCRARLRQQFEDDRLVRLTIIEEPERWWRRRGCA